MKLLCIPGQPRRHLLTTGWSSFVNKKKLVSGDAVLFLRGDDGELRLGVRRAVQLKNEALFEEFSSDSAKRHTLSAVYDSLKHKSVFHISYNPRFVDLAYTVRSGMLYIKHVILAWYNMALLMTYCKKLNSKVK